VFRYIVIVIKLKNSNNKTLTGFKSHRDTQGQY